MLRARVVYTDDWEFYWFLFLVEPRAGRVMAACA